MFLTKVSQKDLNEYQDEVGDTALTAAASGKCKFIGNFVT